MKKKLEKGITLIALIITIVVLLILAVVSIGAVRDSKIIGHAQNAKNLYTEAQEKEYVSLSATEAYIAGNGKIVEANLSNSLNSYFGEGETILTYNEEYNGANKKSYFLIYFVSSKRQYKIYSNGNVELIEEQQKIANKLYEVNVTQNYNEDNNNVTITITDNLESGNEWELLTVEDSAKIIAKENNLELDPSKDVLEEFILKYVKKIGIVENEIDTFNELLKYCSDNAEMIGEDIKTKYDGLNYLLRQLNKNSIQEWAYSYLESLDIKRYLVINGKEQEGELDPSDMTGTITKNGDYLIGVRVYFKVDGTTICSKYASKELTIKDILAIDSYYECTDENNITFRIEFSAKTGLFFMTTGDENKNIADNCLLMFGKYSINGSTREITYDEQEGVELGGTLEINQEGNLIWTVEDDNSERIFLKKEESLFKYYKPIKHFSAESQSVFKNLISGIYKNEEGKLIRFAIDEDEVGLWNFETLDGSRRWNSEPDDEKLEEMMESFNVEVIKENEVIVENKIKYNDQTYTLLNDISEYF